MIWEKIKKILKAKQITQKILSEKTQINYNTLSKILNGKVNNPSITTIKTIASFLLVPYTDLINKDEKPIVYSNELPLHSLWSIWFKNIISRYLEISNKRDYLEDVDWTNDGWKDLTAYRIINWEKAKKKTLFQIKCYKSISAYALNKELDKIKNNISLQKEINEIIFCLSCFITDWSREKIKEYAKNIGLSQDILFWADREINNMILSNWQDLIAEFFWWTAMETTNSLDELKQWQNELKQWQDNSEKNQIEMKEQINKVLERISWFNLLISDHEQIKKLINQWSWPTILNELIHDEKEYLKNKPDDKKLYEIQNNIWIIHFHKWDFDNAIDYFKKAKNGDHIYLKASTNLASAYLNKYTIDKNIKHLEEWYNNIKNVLNRKENEFMDFIWNVVSVTLRTLIFLGKKDELEIFLNRDIFNLPDLEDVDIYEWRWISYGILWELDKATNIINDWLILDPNNFRLRNVKWDLILAKSIEWHNITWLDVLPEIRSLKLLSNSLNCYEKSLENYIWNISLTNDIKAKKIFVEILISKQKWDLHETLKKIRNLDLSDDNLSEQTKHNMEIIKIRDLISCWDFDTAYNIIKPNLTKTSNIENIRLSQIFLINGSPEKAIKILENTNIDNLTKNRLIYRLTLSNSFAMTNNQTKLIQIINKWKQDLKNNKDDYKIFSKHTIALLIRLQQKNANRVLDAALSFQNEFPKEKAIIPVKWLNNNWELSEEMLKILNEAKEKYNHTKNRFLENPVPIYFLSIMYNKTYPELFSFWYDNLDFDFIIESFWGDQKFIDDMLSNLTKSRKIIFDYFSLYNLARSDLLWVLSDLEKDLYIHQDLFDTIQNDLLINEDPVVRKIWDYIRKWNIVKIEKRFNPSSKEKEIKEWFGNWMWQTYKYTQNNKTYTLISDDLRTIRYAKHEAIIVSNSYSIVTHLKNISSIEKDHFSHYLNELWKSFSVFIRFDADDLYNIYSDDRLNWKPDLEFNKWYNCNRSFYHIINQIQLPFANKSSFYKTFRDFLIKLFKSWFTFDDKLNAVLLINAQIETLYIKLLDFFKKNINENIEKNKDFVELLSFHTNIRKLVLDKTKKTEIKTIKEKITKQKDNSTITAWMYTALLNYIDIKENTME